MDPKPPMYVSLLIGTALLFFFGQLARAAVFVVSDGDVSGLKNAINIANVNGQDDTIELGSDGTYTLTTVDNSLFGGNGLPVIGADGGKRLTIRGNGATIQRSAAKDTPMLRVLYVDTGAYVEISDLTITNGTQGISNFNGTLIISDCTFDSNAFEDGGGGIDNGGDLMVYRSTFSGNAGLAGAIANYGNCQVSDSVFMSNSGADGGAISNGAYFGDNATLTIANSTFDGNSAPNDIGGGAIYSEADRATISVEISNSTFDGNSASYGGAIFSNSAGFTTITVNALNCTFSGNSAVHDGGAILNRDIGDGDSFSVFQSTNCTFSGNTAFSGGAIYNEAASGLASLKIRNTILSAGPAGGTIAGSCISLGHNLCTDNCGGSFTAAGDQTNTDPLFDPAGLQNNGGPTKTIALLSKSAAIDASDPNSPARDQRYYLRDGAPDIGAFEYAGVLAPLSAVSRKAHGTAGVFDVDLPLSGSAGIECRSGGANGEHEVVLKFATSVSAGTVTVASGTGGVDNASVIGPEVTINLTGVTNAQQVVLALSGVSDGANTNNVSIPMRILLADVNASSQVNSTDVSQTKGTSGHAVDSANFRADVNASGEINSSDVSSVKLKSGTTLP